MHTLIEADGLCKQFGKIQALDQLSLTVPSGQVVAILGPNGAGKTTFIRTVATLLRPDAGDPARCSVTTCCTSPWPSGVYRPGRPVRRRRGDDDRAGEPDHGGPSLRTERPGGAVEHRSDTRRGGPHRGRRPPGQDVFGRDAPPPRPRGQPGREAAAAAPRRADHRPRPRQPHRALGCDPRNWATPAPTSCSPPSTSTRPTNWPPTSSSSTGAGSSPRAPPAS